MEQEITLKVSQLKWLFVAGMARERENIEVDTDEREEENREAPDFGEFMLTVHDIKLN